MTKLTMLGTGSGGTLELYNTCKKNHSTVKMLVK